MVPDIRKLVPIESCKRESTFLNIRFIPENAKNRSIEFSIREEEKDLATIEADGKIIGKKPGDVKNTIKMLDGSNIESR